MSKKFRSHSHDSKAAERFAELNAKRKAKKAAKKHLAKYGYGPKKFGSSALQKGYRSPINKQAAKVFN